jgi:hypothetical protein
VIVNNRLTLENQIIENPRLMLIFSVRRVIGKLNQDSQVNNKLPKLFLQIKRLSVFMLVLLPEKIQCKHSNLVKWRNNDKLKLE